MKKAEYVKNAVAEGSTKKWAEEVWSMKEFMRNDSKKKRKGNK